MRLEASIHGRGCRDRQPCEVIHNQPDLGSAGRLSKSYRSRHQPAGKKIQDQTADIKIQGGAMASQNGFATISYWATRSKFPRPGILRVMRRLPFSLSARWMPWRRSSFLFLRHSAACRSLRVVTACSCFPPGLVQTSLAPARALSTLQLHNRDSSRDKALETGIAHTGIIRKASLPAASTPLADVT